MVKIIFYCLQRMANIYSVRKFPTLNFLGVVFETIFVHDYHVGDGSFHPSPPPEFCCCYFVQIMCSHSVKVIDILDCSDSLLVLKFTNLSSTMMLKQASTSRFALKIK